MTAPNLERHATANEFEDKMKVLFYTAKEQGWTITRTWRGHYFWRPPAHLTDKGMQVVNSSSRNPGFSPTLRLLRNNGLLVDEHGHSSVIVKPKPFKLGEELAARLESTEKKVCEAYREESPPNASTAAPDEGLSSSVEGDDSSISEFPLPAPSGPEVTSSQGSVSQSPPSTTEDTVAKSKRRDLSELREAVSRAYQSFPGTVKVEQILEKVSVKFPFADSPMISKLSVGLVAKMQLEKHGRGLYRWIGGNVKTSSRPETTQADAPSMEEELSKLVDALLTVTVGLQDWAKRVEKRAAKDRKLRERVQALLGEESE